MDFIIKKPMFFAMQHPILVITAWASTYICAAMTTNSISIGIMLLLLIAAILPALIHALSHIKHIRGSFWSRNIGARVVQPMPLEALEYVLTHAVENDCVSVINAFDTYCWSGNWMMNVGDVKGKIVDEVIIKYKPRIGLELGAFCGYSTVRFAGLMKSIHNSDNNRIVNNTNSQDGTIMSGIDELKCVLHSVDPSTLGHAIQGKLINYAGVSDCVKSYYGYSSDYLKMLARENVKLDFIFLDHLKDLYLCDLQLAISLGLLKKGTVVVADNVLTPGAPDYKEWILCNGNFSTEVFSTYLEYSTTVKDEVLVSIYNSDD